MDKRRRAIKRLEVGVAAGKEQEKETNRGMEVRGEGVAAALESEIETKNKEFVLYRRRSI